MQSSIFQVYQLSILIIYVTCSLGYIHKDCSSLKSTEASQTYDILNTENMRTEWKSTIFHGQWVPAYPALLATTHVLHKYDDDLHVYMYVGVRA